MHTKNGPNAYNRIMINIGYKQYAHQRLWKAF